MDKKRFTKFILKLVISFLFLFLIITKVDWPAFWEKVKTLSLFSVLVYVLILLSGMLISAFKWQIILKYKNKFFSIKDLFVFYLTGSFINNFMPSFIGGDTYRSYQTGKDQKDYTVSTSAVILDRITGLLGGWILSIFFGIINYGSISKSHILLLIFWVATLGFFTLLILMFFYKTSFFKNKLLIFIPKKIKDFTAKFFAYGDLNLLLKALLISIFYTFVGVGLLNYVLFLAFGIQISFLNYLSVIFLISIISAIPISINNIGLKEWAYVTFFGFFGVAASSVVAVAIVSRILQMLVSFTAFPIYLKTKKVRP